MAKETPEESFLVGSGLPCPHCGSKDNVALYSSGWYQCFSPGCKSWKEDGDNAEVSTRRTHSEDNRPFIHGDAQGIPKRGISEPVCKRYHYYVGRVPEDYPCSEKSAIHKMKGQKVHIENYYDDSGNLVAQKLRDRHKNFATIGKLTSQLFGRHCVKPGGKTIVLTEGAIDTLSYAELRKNWPAVSIPNGANSAVKAVKENLEFLESFGQVVICFDNDDEGRKAAESVKGLLSPKKAYIASLPEEYKDLNEALMEGDYKAALQAVMNAEMVSPDGLVSVDDILDEAMKPIEWGLPWFIDELTQLTYGRRYGEIYALGGGTGTGKTDIFTEQIKYDTQVLGLRVGTLFLEQMPKETVKRVAGKIAGKRFHVPDAGWTEDELREACKALSGKMMLYDSFGETEWDKVKTRIRHMAVAEGIRIFYVDHLTAMADTGDERGSIEQIMKEMAGLANELKIIIHFISHLSTPDGIPHEEGGRVAIRHFKGSRSIGFWSFFMFGLERDQQAEDEEDRHTTTFRILKDRYTGQSTGETLLLGYDKEAGAIIPHATSGFPKTSSTDEGF